MEGINWNLPKWSHCLEKTFLYKVPPKFLQAIPFRGGPLKQSECTLLLASKSIPSWLKAPQITYQPLWQELYCRSHLTSKGKPRMVINHVITIDSMRQLLYLRQTVDHCREKARDVWAFCQNDIATFHLFACHFFLLLANVKGIGPPSHNLVKWSQI